MLLQLITGLKVYCSVKETNLKTYWGWENGSVGKVLALQVQDLSLSPITEIIVAQAYKPSTRGKGSWEEP